MPEARIAIDAGSARGADKSARAQALSAAVEAGGGIVVEPAEANGLISLHLDADRLKGELERHKDIAWVQLPMAGVEPLAEKHVFDRNDVTFTCAKGLFGPEVGEHAFMLTMTALRNVVQLARSKKWTRVEVQGLYGKRITIVGGGGIAETATKLFNAAGSVVTVLRKKPDHLAGAQRTLPIGQLHEVLPETDVLILAMALTPETEGMVGARELGLLPKGAVVVNVARGKVLDTDALVKALKSGQVGAAGLDVTEPEPLPKRHKLWKMDNVLITCHYPNPDDTATKRLAGLVEDNVRRFRMGYDLLGKVDNTAGY